MFSAFQSIHSLSMVPSYFLQWPPNNGPIVKIFDDIPHSLPSTGIWYCQGLNSSLKKIYYSILFWFTHLSKTALSPNVVGTRNSSPPLGHQLGNGKDKRGGGLHKPILNIAILPKPFMGTIHLSFPNSNSRSAWGRLWDSNLILAQSREAGGTWS